MTGVGDSAPSALAAGHARLEGGLNLGTATGAAAGAIKASAGATINGHSLWTTDNTYDVGAAGATRPRNLYLGSSVKESVALGARAYHNTTQTSTENTWVSLALNSERFDNDTIHDNSTNNSRLTCKTAGVYLIFGNAEFAGGGSTQGPRGIRILLNGTTVIAEDYRNATVDQPHALNISAPPYELAVNDYVELQVYCTNTGVGNLTINASANYSPEFGMVRVA